MDSRHQPDDAQVYGTEDGFGSPPQAGRHHQQHCALTYGHIGVGEDHRLPRLFYRVAQLPILGQHESLGKLGEIVHIAGKQEAKLGRLLVDHPVDGKNGEVIRAPGLERHLILSHQLLQRLTGLDEAGHVVFTKRTHLAQLHREGMGTVAVRAVIAEGGGGATGKQYGAHPAGTEELHLLLAVRPLMGEGVDSKLLVARTANGGVQVVVITGPGRIGKEAAHILLEAHGANALLIAQPLPLAVGTGEEPVHVLLHFPQPQVHGGRVAKQEQHPMTGAELTAEQPGQQLVADLDGGGFVAVNAAGEDDILAAPGLIARATGRLQAERSRIPDAHPGAIGQVKREGLKLPLVVAGQGQKIMLGNHPSHPFVRNAMGGLYARRVGLKSVFKQIQTVRIQS